MDIDIFSSSNHINTSFKNITLPRFLKMMPIDHDFLKRGGMERRHHGHGRQGWARV
jgi:hypothetical protein